ncbi:MAG: hypothetical protein COS89_01880 [Deltaproteobacteria bacterium CG07_land_8_20_14_0_80_38_7]|nr:MAG: hypothetical protein COS89_01880 [Deltaproteobacteria bacterium CG07_land_8_20_14_0_80_38_7]
MKKLFMLCVAFIALLAVGCGSSNTSTEFSTEQGDQTSSSSNNISDQGKAASVVFSEITGKTSTNGADGYNQGRSYNEDVPDLSIVEYVTQVALNELFSDSKAGVYKTPVVTTSSDSISVTFNNEPYTINGGLVFLNGTLTLSMISDYVVTFDGQITSDINEVTETVTLNSINYIETITGQTSMTFSGSFTFSESDSTVESNLSITTVGDNIQITGTVTGLASTNDFTISITGDASNTSTMLLACSGSINVALVDTGTTETCSISADCNDCL